MSVIHSFTSLDGLRGLATPHLMVGAALVLVFGIVASAVLLSLQKSKLDWNKGLLSYIQFAYSCFLKPHERDGMGQQHALESFYRAQVYSILLI
jgi:betaine lipid synthase